MKLYSNSVDTCDICNVKSLSKKAKQKHQDEAYKARQALKDNSIAVTFNLQKAHEIQIYMNIDL